MSLIAAQTALKKYFGYDKFRPQQAEIIEKIYQKKDVIVLMPTGGGKSICFQIPAITMDGVCIVVSPLISLMKDQVEGLRGNGIEAAFLNSSQDSAEQRLIEDKLFSGKLRLLYVSPEKLMSSGFLTMLKSLTISLFAIDEAHCISSWGHDFRPEYTQLKILREHFRGIPIVALTATADKITRRDMAAQLGLDEPEIFVASFDRPNLSLDVRQGQKRFEQIIDFLQKKQGQSGIIYCLSKKTCEDIAAKLKQKGIKADYYHAGLTAANRSKVQEDFINDRTPIICATVAFGMGIDKPNVRWVIHYNMPKNIEGYYQEIGRGGRDGLPSDTILFFSYGDYNAMREMFSKDEVNPAQVELQLAKLQRMFEYADTKICRRRMLLAYFSEDFDKNCGNCDVCKHPPKYEDGSVIAQKALSAVARCGEKVGINLLIDILRGSHRQEIVKNGFDQIKTYGAGRDFSPWTWTNYIGQLLQLGLLEIAYDQGNVLKITNAAREVLFEKRPVSLIKPMTKVEKEVELAFEKATQQPQRAQQAALRGELFERLRVLRKELAVTKGQPPYLIFGDATLENMVEMRPSNEYEMLQVSGVGENKWQLYGQIFLDEIIQYVAEKTATGEVLPPIPPKSYTVSSKSASKSASKEPAAPKINTYKLTYDLYAAGKNVADIADERGLSPTTVFSHLTTMYARGEKLAIEKWIRPEELDIIGGALSNFEQPFQLSLIFAHFQERYSYEQIRVAIAHVERVKFLAVV
jgi:ATP-dependent DNA helicase RecQ